MASDSQESMDLFQVSQDSQNQPENGAVNLPDIDRPVTMKMIYDELCIVRKELRESKGEVTKLKESVTTLQNMRTGSTSNFRIEGSNVKKPLIAFLKRLFLQYSWLCESDEDLKRNFSSILEQCGWEVNGSMLITCFSFASHSFTNWRNQIRQKLVTPDRNVEGMSLKALQRYLFSAFWLCPSVTDENKNFRLTLALRAFADGHKLFRKAPNATSIDFWRAFKKNIDSMMKQSPERWTSLEQKHTRKIEALNKED